MLAAQMRFARPEKGQQRQPGNARVGLRSGAAPIVAHDGPRLAACAVSIGVPAAVAALSRGQPVERRGDRRFCSCCGAKRLGRLQPVGCDTGRERRGDIQAIAQTLRRGSRRLRDKLVRLARRRNFRHIGSQRLLIGGRLRSRRRRAFHRRRRDGTCRIGRIRQQIGQLRLLDRAGQGRARAGPAAGSTGFSSAALAISGGDGCFRLVPVLSGCSGDGNSSGAVDSPACCQGCGEAEVTGAASTSSAASQSDGNGLASPAARRPVQNVRAIRVNQEQQMRQQRQDDAFRDGSRLPQSCPSQHRQQNEQPDQADGQNHIQRTTGGDGGQKTDIAHRLTPTTTHHSLTHHSPFHCRLARCHGDAHLRNARLPAGGHDGGDVLIRRETIAANRDLQPFVLPIGGREQSCAARSASRPANRAHRAVAADLDRAAAFDFAQPGGPAHLRDRHIHLSLDRR